MFGVGIGVGVAIDHGDTSSTPSAAQVTRIRDRQQALDTAKAAQVAARAAALARRQSVLAREQAQDAGAAKSRAQQQLAWIQECEAMYPVPASRADPDRAHASARRAACVDAAVRTGVSPVVFRRNTGP